MTTDDADSGFIKSDVIYNETECIVRVGILGYKCPARNG
jgi:hypothetical protein